MGLKVRNSTTSSRDFSHMSSNLQKQVDRSKNSHIKHSCLSRKTTNSSSKATSSHGRLLYEEKELTHSRHTPVPHLCQQILAEPKEEANVFAEKTRITVAVVAVAGIGSLYLVLQAFLGKDICGSMISRIQLHQIAEVYTEVDKQCQDKQIDR